MSAEKPVAVIDTDVASFMLKSLPIGWEYARLIAGFKASVSFITAGELLFGAESRSWGSRRRLSLDLFLSERAVMPFQAGMERLFARIMAERERMGRRMEKADAWIATTAIFHDAPLVTHDGDVRDTRGLRIVTASKEARTAQVRMPVVSGRPLNLDMRCQCSM